MYMSERTGVRDSSPYECLQKVLSNDLLVCICNHELLLGCSQKQGNKHVVSKMCYLSLHNMTCAPALDQECKWAWAHEDECMSSANGITSGMQKMALELWFWCTYAWPRREDWQAKMCLYNDLVCMAR